MQFVVRLASLDLASSISELRFHDETRRNTIRARKVASSFHLSFSFFELPLETCGSNAN